MLRAGAHAPPEVVEYFWSGASEPAADPLVSVHWIGAGPLDLAALSAWAAGQTLAEVRVETGPPGAAEIPAPWFLALDRIPTSPAALLEAAWLVAACEEVGRVTLASETAFGISGSDAVTLCRTADWEWDAALRRPRARSARWLAKTLSPNTVETGTVRCAEYIAPAPGPRKWRVGLREPAARRPMEAVGGTPPRVLVTAPFLARGGAEQTLLETTRYLAATGAFEFAFATLAPHRPELGDRRREFLEVSDRLYSLGDLLHPAAMYGALLSLVDALGVDLLYNANGSTLFYEYAQRLRQDRPRIAIVDHLYDHRVGYIEWYAPERVAPIDLCIAENHPIAAEVSRRVGWAAARVPVVWPCGRPAAEGVQAPPSTEARLALRREAGAEERDLLVLTAARVHEQKRPLDWVALAQRLRDTRLRFVWVGGGPLEGELDRAIGRARSARLARLPFREDVPQLLAASDLACLVSEFEGLPVFLLEALQAGRPFFATDVGDVRRVLESTGAGVVAGAPGDLDALERVARSLLDDELRTRCGRRAAAAAPEFGVPAVSERYRRAFLGAIAGRAC